MKITPDNDPANHTPTPTADALGLPGADALDEVAAAFADKFARLGKGDNPFPDITQADDADADEIADADAGDSGTDTQQAEPAADLPAVDGQTEDAPPPSAPVASDHLSVPLPDGKTFDLTADVAQGYIALGAWAQNLQPETRQAFAAIESGQAVAITRADYEQFEAWRSTKGQLQGAPSQDTWQHLEESGVDPVIIAQLRAQEQKIVQLQQPAPQDFTAAQHELNAKQAAYESGEQNWASTRGITDATTLERLRSIAIRDGVIPTLVERGRQYSPTGVLLRDADLTQVAAQAMNYALATDPELHSEVLTRSAAGPEPTSPTASDRRVNEKKARAGSLAAAPSTAVPSPSGPTTNNVQALTDAMAGFISQRMNGDT